MCSHFLLFHFLSPRAGRKQLPQKKRGWYRAMAVVGMLPGCMGRAPVIKIAVRKKAALLEGFS